MSDSPGLHAKQDKLRIEAEKQAAELKERQRAVGQRKAQKRMLMWGVLAIIVVISISLAVFSIMRPGPADNFAKCLSSKNVQVYGNLKTCAYTRAQKTMFGKSFKFLDYHDASEWPEQYGDIKVTPTWVVNGQIVPNVQDFKTLSQLSGCPLT